MQNVSLECVLPEADKGPFGCPLKHAGRDARTVTSRKSITLLKRSDFTVPTASGIFTRVPFKSFSTKTSALSPHRKKNSSFFWGLRLCKDWRSLH